MFMTTRDLFMRHTATDGRSYVQCHRVWDAPRFIAARQQEAQRLNTEATAQGKPAKAAAEQITEEAYRSERAAA